MICAGELRVTLPGTIYIYMDRGLLPLPNLLLPTPKVLMVSNFLHCFAAVNSAFQTPSRVYRRVTLPSPRPLCPSCPPPLCHSHPPPLCHSLPLPCVSSSPSPVSTVGPWLCPYICVHCVGSHEMCWNLITDITFWPFFCLLRHSVRVWCVHMPDNSLNRDQR